MFKTLSRSKTFLTTCFAAVIFCLLGLVPPAINKSSASVSTLLVCPSDSIIGQLGGVNAPRNNSNNYFYNGVGRAIFDGQELNKLSQYRWSTFHNNSNWVSGSGQDGGRYPGVRLGSGPWNINGASVGINGLGVGQRLGNGNYDYYSDLQNNCGSDGSLEANIVRDSNAILPQYNDGNVHRSTIRISTPVGNVDNVVGESGSPRGSDVGFMTINTKEGLRAKWTVAPNSNGRTNGTGWQARTVVFTPNADSSSSGSDWEKNQNILGCVYYSASDTCNAPNVVSQGTWNNAASEAAGNYEMNYYLINLINYLTGGASAAWISDLILPNRMAEIAWSNGNTSYGSSYKNPPSAAANPANAFRQDFVAEVFCNMKSSNLGNYNTCKADGTSNAIDAYAKIKDFAGWIVDQESPTTDLYKAQAYAKTHPLQYGGNQREDVWINSRPNTNYVLKFNAMDGGLGIASANPTVNGTPLGARDWTSQCTEWGTVSGMGSVQYRLDRSQQVARTGPAAFGRAERWSINQPPVCSAIQEYETASSRTNLSNTTVWKEGVNIFRANLVDYTKPGSGLGNSASEEREIKIDSVEPVVNFAAIASGGGGRCYSPSTGINQSGCLGVENSSPESESKYISGTVNFTSIGDDPRGELPNSSSNHSHSGLAYEARNIFRINGNIVKDCAVPAYVATYNYNTSLYQACSDALNTKSYDNGSIVRFQTNIKDRVNNRGEKLSQRFIIDNIAPNNTSSTVGNDLIKLSATDPANGSGVKNNQVEYRVQVEMPGAGTTGTFVANGTSINIGATNSIVWVRAEDNVGNVSNWKKFDFTEPEAAVFCEETTKVNMNWYGPGEIPCWIEASGNDGRTARITLTQYEYMTPDGSANSGWNINQLRFFMDGDERNPAYQPISVGNPQVEMTLPVPYPLFDMGGENLEGVFKGRKYLVITRTGIDWNPAKAAWLSTGWENPKIIAQYPSNYFFSTADGGVKPSTERLNSTSPEKYMITAYIQPWISELQPGSEFTIGALALRAGQTIVSVPRSESAQSGWTRIRSQLSVPAASTANPFTFIPPFVTLSKAPTGNEASPKPMLSLDYTLISKVFDIPAGIQGKTDLLGRSYNANGIWSQNDSKSINKDATPPDLNDKRITASIDTTPDDGVNTSGRQDNDGKYSGFMRLSIDAKDLFVGDSAYTPDDSELESAARTAAQNLKTAYENVSASIRSSWEQKSSGMTSGSWIACSVNSVGENKCLETPPDSLTDATGYSPYFVIQQDNALVPDLCRGTTFVGTENGNYSCIFDTRILPFRQGDYYIRFRAEDGAGNVSYSAPEKVSIAKQACEIPGNITP